ncbi:GNAT family N-acetyltransferase [Lysobacter korlensis]|uniref:GNAT family N-acetyltransferase n=1 Tax=Lysobacter korlensis TaxID=553636 RepID=A0ABV6RL91_9GAMM
MASPGLAVRDATTLDVPSITALHAHEADTGVSAYECLAPSEAEMAKRWQASVQQGFPYLVAELDGQFAGYAYASSYRAREGYRWTVEDTVYVLPAARGRGVGIALLRSLIDVCTRLGYRQMIAVIGDGTSTGSIALHERLGFLAAGVFPGMGWKHGRWLDNVQMLLPLGAGRGAPPDRA